MKGIFGSYYCAPIIYYALLIKNEAAIIDIYENYKKQTYRNRCCIMSPNGKQNMTIPLVKAKQKKLMKNVKIFNIDKWQHVHWRSLEAAYRCSPYFEYYEDEFYSFYHDNKFTYLIEFNKALHQKIVELIGIDQAITYSESYQEANEMNTDYRENISPRSGEGDYKFAHYIQVFEDRNQFMPNLSILDLLFNEGPNTKNYLNSIIKDV